ncbi:MAG: protein kinase domain-containing protein [Acidobacteriota bacterium]
MGDADDRDEGGGRALPRASTGEVTAADTPRTRDGTPNLAPLLARFTIRGTLGEGGMGTVVEAYDKVLSREVAIKVLTKDPLADPAVGERFLREARAAARLGHAGIVQVYDVDPAGGFIVMELVRGESLSARLHREGVLPVAEVRRIGTALLDALGFAHAAGIVHRDVKPANVLLGDKGEVKLADFGVAFFGDSDLTLPGTRVGTPMYMAPEQLRARDVDARADVYAAGVTLFEAATGKRLHDDDAPGDPAALVATATGDRVLAAAIARAVRERPAERFTNGRAFADALEATESAATVPPPAPRRRWPVIAALVAAAGLAAGGGAVWLARGGHAKAARATTGRHTVALLPFADTTRDPLLDFAGAGLPNLLGLELHGVPDVKVIGYYQLLSNVRGPDAPPGEWVTAAQKLGADVLVRGDLSRARDQVRVLIRIESAGGDQLDEIERETRVEDVPEVVRSAAPQVARAVIGHSIEPTARTAAPFSAERELQLGIADVEREKLDDAVDHLRAAIHEAPQLALAHYYLAIALYWQAPPAGPAREEIDKALALGLDDAQQGMLAALRALVGQDYQQGIALLRPLAEKYPDDREVLYVLFESLFHGGRPAEAMGVYRRIVALEPRFRLALVHAFTFYVSHADDAGMAWALALSDPSGDTYNRVWEPRILIARREYEAAIRLLSRVIDESTTPASDLKLELATAYLLSDQLDLATALLRQLAEADAGGMAEATMSLAIARGDEAARRQALDRAIRQAAINPNGPGRNITLQKIAGSALLAARPEELAELSQQIEASVIADFGHSLNLNAIELLLADARGDRARVRSFVDSPYPEVGELAKGLVARAQGDHATAADDIRRAIATTGDARFIIDDWYLLAGELHALSDPSGVIGACDEVIRARLFSWQWGAAVAPCLVWTAEAHGALGHTDQARAAWQRLATLRSADDALGQKARAALAR